MGLRSDFEGAKVKIARRIGMIADAAMRQGTEYYTREREDHRSACLDVALRAYQQLLEMEPDVLATAFAPTETAAATTSE